MNKGDKKKSISKTTSAIKKNSKQQTYSSYIDKLISNLSSPDYRYESLEKLQAELPAQKNVLGSITPNETSSWMLNTPPNKYIRFNPNPDIVLDGSSASTASSSSLKQQVLTQSDEQVCIHLPPFKWSFFKRGYTLGMWLYMSDIKHNMTLFQFRQSKYGGIGICCTINPPPSSPNSTLNNNEYQVTIYTLPFSHKRGQYIRSKITFVKNEWQFWCISHDNPFNVYVSRPKLYFSINGVLQFSSELVYPPYVNPNSANSESQQGAEEVMMEENTLLGGGGNAMEGGHLAQVLLWREALFTSQQSQNSGGATDYLSGYIGEMGPNVTYQVIIPSIPINRDAMYHDYSSKSRRNETGIGIPNALHNTQTMMLSKTESKLKFRFVPKEMKNGVVILENVILDGELKACPKLGVVQPLVEKSSEVKLAIIKKHAEIYHKKDFPHVFYCIGGLHSTLIPLFEAFVKPPGTKHTLQPELTINYISKRKSFDFKFYFEKVLVFLAQCLQSFSYIREEAVQTGFCSNLSYLVGLVLEDKNINLATYEKSIIVGLLALMDACCGGNTGDNGRMWEVPPSSSMHIRRTSDLALQFLHTFVFHLSLYKNSTAILSALLTSFLKKYRYLGEFIMKHISIQFILDQIYLLDKMEKQSAFELFYFLVFNSLQFSEFCERDVTNTITHLTICPLGNVASYVIFQTFDKIVESGDVDVMIKLGRYLILSEFHSVIGPVLLSRAVNLFNKDEDNLKDLFKENSDGSFDWKIHWRTAFLLFVWLTSVSSTEGEGASQHFGNLLYKSAVSGSLNDCMQNEEFIDCLLPPNTNTIDRLKALIPLLPGIFVLLKQDSELRWLCQLLSKMSFFIQKFRTSLSVMKISKEYVPIFISLFCIILQNEDQTNAESAVIQETCQESLLGILSNLILICMKHGKECSFEVWKSVFVSIKICEDLISDKKEILSKVCGTVLKSLCSLDHSATKKKMKEPQMTWSVELTQGVSRFILFIEEKELFRKNSALVMGLIKILSIGREDLGWLQTIPRHGMGDKDDDKNGAPMRTVLPIKNNNARGVNNAPAGGGAAPPPSSNNLSGRMPDSTSSSKYLLPVLQPALRMILFSLEEGTQKNIREIRLTISAALVGLIFQHARDLGLQTLSSLRKALKNITDPELLSSYQDLVLFTTNELYVRYQNERMVKYSHSSDTNDEDAFETMILGNDLKRNDEDFITSQISAKSSTLGFNFYSGLGAALDSACTSSFDDVKDGDGIDDVENKMLNAATTNIFTLLEKYLNKWDETLKKDDEECFSIPMFSDDDGIQSVDSYIVSIFQKSLPPPVIHTSPSNESNNNPKTDISDIIAHYIEIVSLERNRIENAKTTVLEIMKKETATVVENNFWKVFRENYSRPSENMQWERAFAQDGGRDSYARLVTLPNKPEFERTLPDFLNPNVKPGLAEETKKEDEIEFSDIAGKLKIVNIMKTKSRPNLYKLDEDEEDDDSIVDFPHISPSTSSDEEDEKQTPSIKGKDDETEQDKTVVTEDETLSVEQNSTVASSTANTIETNNDKGSVEGTTTTSTPTPLDYHAQPYPISSFALPPDTPSISAQTTTSTNSIFSSNIELYYDNCLHIRPEGSRKGVLFLTSSYILLEYESNEYEGNESSKIPCEGVNFCKWSIAELSHVYLRRYRLRDSALEFFYLPSGGSSSYASSSSAFFDFGPGAIGNQKRDSAANAILKRAPHQCTKQWPDKSSSFLLESLNKITLHWCCGTLSNFDYLMEMNILAGRSFNDLCQYPIFPWTLCNFESEEVPDLTDKNNFRDMTKPMGALNEERLKDFIERYETFNDPTIPPFMYGSHYSTSAGVVLHFLVRLHPFANLHRQLQSGHFDVADRLFSNIQRTFDMCTGASAAEVKELTPEWYCNPNFLRNTNNFYLGQSQDGEVLGDVVLPPWAKGSPEKFVEVMKMALESDICTAMLPSWVDLIFGYKQQGPEAVKAHNVFFYLTYYGSIDVAAIEDEGLRTATELQIAHFGQCPMQLFWKPHVSKLPQASRRFRFSLNHVWENKETHYKDSELTEWVFLPPPPLASKNLVIVRICGIEKIVAVDENGVFHFFRWMWKPDEISEEDQEHAEPHEDKGCFLTQRECINMRVVPRLAFVPQSRPPVLAISQTMFASHTLLLVLSDGDGKGGLALQFLDPGKNIIRGVAVIPYVHSARITCIAMDTMGSSTHVSHHAGGGGGVGGELAIVGAEDGSATLWRFISSHYLPLRPRLRLRGHYGSPILSVSISSSLNICVTVSKTRCCLFHLGNGQLLRSFRPTEGSLFGSISCISEGGYIVLLCLQKSKAVLTLFTLEGICIGEKNFPESPRKVITIQRNVVGICTSSGTKFCLLSTVNPFTEVDECFSGKEAYDLDIGPYPKQIITAMASSNSSLLIHALPGITAYSEENRKVAMSTAVGNALSKPVQKIRGAVGNVVNRGTRFVENRASTTSNSGGISGFFSNPFGKPRS